MKSWNDVNWARRSLTFSRLPPAAYVYSCMDRELTYPSIVLTLYGKRTPSKIYIFSLPAHLGRVLRLKDHRSSLGRHRAPAALVMKGIPVNINGQLATDRPRPKPGGPLGSPVANAQKCQRLPKNDNFKPLAYSHLHPRTRPSIPSPLLSPQTQKPRRQAPCWSMPPIILAIP